MAPLIADELIDDASDIVPSIGLTGSLNLTDRLADRIGRLSHAEVVVLQDSDSHALRIHMALPSSTRGDYVERTKTFCEHLQVGIRQLAGLQDSAPKDDDLKRKKAVQGLQDAILRYTSQDTDETIKKMRRLFEDYDMKFRAVVDRMFSLDDVDASGSLFDTVMGACIIRLQQLARDYDDTCEKQTDLAEFAYGFIRTEADVAVRMKSLLGFVFSTTLYDLVCRLGHSLRTLDTVQRVAASKTSLDIEVHYVLPPPRPRKITPDRAQARAGGPRPAILSGAPVLSPRYYGGFNDDINILKPYLSHEEQNLPFHKLQPAKQNAAMLVTILTRGLVPSPSTEAHHSFGFVACETSEAQRALRSTYCRFLSRGPSKAANFHDLVTALESNSLPLLPDLDGYHGKLVMPRLVKQFLFAAPHDRPSVFRLIQFLRDTHNVEPPPCVKRDFGFQMCTQRGHVAALKELYERVLEKTGPTEVHWASKYCGLWRLAVKCLGRVDGGMRRFLDYEDGNPGVGFDNEKGLERYMAPLFKKSLRK